MNHGELKAALVELALSQSDFSRLLEVTPRAVALWMSGERAVPGAAAAYLRVFKLLPLSLRQIELSRLKQRGTGMRDGMFEVSYQARHGKGVCVLVFDAGKVYGSDAERVRYDGEYMFDESTSQTNAKLKVSFPPNVTSVFGISNPYEWALDVTTSFDPRVDSGKLVVTTSLREPLHAEYRFLRALPDTL